MSFKWSESSKAKLKTVDIKLKAVADRALSYGLIDATVIEGRRGQAKQTRLFRIGKTKFPWPKSKHNAEGPYMAEAVDIAPYIKGKGLPWKKEHCIFWAGLMMAAAKEEGVKIRWGGNWDRDSEPVTDQSFDDLVHFELDE